DTLYPPPVFTFRLFRLGDNYSDTGGLCQDRQSNYDAVESITHCVFSVIERSAECLKEQPEKLAEAIATHLNSASPVLNHLIAKVLKCYP
ncbi:hypothetical protein, partial [Aeromonas rivipollensis]|uniref:hypothetical protein n=1 Tax=Aeromonas rivipollensis TaxID=948519 RepID=UPI003D245B6B